MPNSPSLQVILRFLSNAPAHAQQAVMQSFAPNRQDRAAGDLVQGLGVEGFRGLGLEAEMMTNTIL